MKNLIFRTLFGALYVAVVIAAILLGKYYLGAVFLFFAVFSVREWVVLAGMQDNRTMTANAIVGAVGLYAVLWLQAFMPEMVTPLYWLAYAFFALGTLAYSLRFPSPSPLHYWGTFLSSQLMVALPFALLSLIAAADTRWVLMLFILLWVNDTFAYIVGMLTAKLPNGNHKMSPTISPKKSWEGLAGGVAGALLAGWVFFRLQWIDTAQHALCLSAIVALAGVVGDLMESQLKRSVGVKDSGNFLPGHGGALDRFDSLLFAAPIYAIFLYLFGLITL